MYHSLGKVLIFGLLMIQEATKELQKSLDAAQELAQAELRRNLLKLETEKVCKKPDKKCDALCRHIKGQTTAKVL